MGVWLCCRNDNNENNRTSLSTILNTEDEDKEVEDKDLLLDNMIDIDDEINNLCLKFIY